MDWISALRIIRDAEENDRLVVFVGAGISQNSGIPSWYDLIKKFADELNYDRCDFCAKKDSDCPKEQCPDRYSYAQEEFLRIPEYYYQQDTSEQHVNYYNLIRDTLHCDNFSNPINDEIFSIFPRHIITTNYDHLLEKSHAANSSLYTVVSQDSDLLASNNNRYILKMHGDIENPSSIVLRESDYITYEQEHPLISTFIKSLLINHTFVFLGYSLNDNNLNLIIGWINYFRELHNISHRPKNLLISSKPAPPFEQDRLQSKNIFVVDLNTLPIALEEKASTPPSLSHPAGRKLFTFLRCITDPKTAFSYIPIKDQISEKYQLLKAYFKISHHDLIAVYPLGKTDFWNSELVFYERPWYDHVQELLLDKDSLVAETFVRAGITTIRFYDENLTFSVPKPCSQESSLFKLYLDNNYSSLEAGLECCDDLLQKLYYNHLLGKGKRCINSILSLIDPKTEGSDYVSLLLYKTISRTATLSFDDRQEGKTLELRKIFNATPPKPYQNAVSFLRMLFDSPTKNIQKMADLLEKHENLYSITREYNYMGYMPINLIKLKAFAYDYYFFFKKNGISLDYFSDPKEYLSFYLRALLSSFSPEPVFANASEPLRLLDSDRNYPISEIDLDMLVKYTTPKNLQSWLKKYSVQKIEIETELNVSQKFVNLCSSLSRFEVKYWIEQIHCFAIILSLIELDFDSRISICQALTNLSIKFSKSYPSAFPPIYDAIEVFISHIPFEDIQSAKLSLLLSLLSENLYPVLITRRAGSFSRLLHANLKHFSSDTKEQLRQNIIAQADMQKKINNLYFFREFFPKHWCATFFDEHFRFLSTEQVFRLIVDKILPFSKGWPILLETLAKEEKERISNPGFRTYPDHLLSTIEQCIILKLLGFEVIIDTLRPYAYHSAPLTFMLSPDTFDYSLVDTANYMWQNLIYSEIYQPYFIGHKEEILSDNLKDIFHFGVASQEQQKVIYGILLNHKDLHDF